MLPGLLKEVLWLEMSATRKEYHHDEGFPPNNEGSCNSILNEDMLLKNESGWSHIATALVGHLILVNVFN